MNFGIKEKKKFELKGKYRIRTKNKITGEERVSPFIENLIMLDDGIGLNLILRRLGNDLTYDCIITTAEIGTGTTPPTDSDTDLDTMVLDGIIPAEQTIGIDDVTISFFIPDVDLPNGTYHEFLIRCGTQAFARSIIIPAYTKASNEDTTVEYIISANNS